MSPNDAWLLTESRAELAFHQRATVMTYGGSVNLMSLKQMANHSFYAEVYDQQLCKRPYDVNVPVKRNSHFSEWPVTWHGHFWTLCPFGANGFGVESLFFCLISCPPHLILHSMSSTIIPLPLNLLPMVAPSELLRGRLFSPSMNCKAVLLQFMSSTMMQKWKMWFLLQSAAHPLKFYTTLP